MNPVQTNIKSIPDEELVKQIQAGQDYGDRFFKLIYERHAKWIYNKCVQFVGVDDAVDLSQEIFVKVYLNIGKFNFNSKLSTWLFTITYRMCVDATEKQKKKQQAHHQYTEDISASSEYEIWEDEKIDRVLMEIKFTAIENIMDIVDVSDKTILLMKYQDEMKLRQISEILEISEGAVKMKLRRAKERILKIYEKKINHEKSI